MDAFSKYIGMRNATQNANNGENKMSNFGSTMTFKVRAINLVAKHLGFDLNTMMSRGFSFGGCRGGDWVITFNGRDAFLVDLVLSKVSEVADFNLFLRQRLLK